MTNIAPSLSPLDITRTPDGGEIGPVQSGWRLAIREFAKNRLAVAGIGILLFFVLFCFVGPTFYQGNIVNTDLTSTGLPPSAGHPLGTTDVGFDELGLLMKGGQAALEIGFAAAFIGIVIGMLWGAIAGLAGGIVDRGEVLTLRTRDLVSAARTAGSGRWRLINKHLLPNALSVIVVMSPSTSLTQSSR